MLNDLKINSAEPSEKTLRLFDARGLYLEISPAGGKWWRFKYRFAGREKRLSLGVYPTIKLRDARERAEASWRMLANGVDPSAHRKAEKLASGDRSRNAASFLARIVPTTAPKYSGSSRVRNVTRVKTQNPLHRRP
jgi:hypothetical protein